VVGVRIYHAPMSASAGWIEIGDRFYVRRYAFYDQNIGLVLGHGAALVIDTRSTYGQARDPRGRALGDAGPRHGGV